MKIAPPELSRKLRTYLDGFAGVPVEWGRSDCCMFLAGWLSLNGARLVLPAYRSEIEGLRLIRNGLVGVLEQVARQSGIARTYAPRFGDVCVVEMESGQKGAIHLHGPYVAVRTDDSYLCLEPCKVLASWDSACAA